MNLKLRDQCRATFSQFVHPTQSNAWSAYSPQPGTLGRFGSLLLSDCNWVMLSHVYSHSTFWGTTQTAIVEVNSLICLSNSDFCTMDHQQFSKAAISVMELPPRQCLCWSHLVLFFQFLWQRWSACIALVTCNSSQWDKVCCVVSGSMFGWCVKLK